MLARILEPEVMDSAEEACDYDAMDHSQVNCTFVSDFLGIWHGSHPIIDVGTGTAQIPIALLQSAPQAQVVAIDLAQHMLNVGDENVRRAGLEHAIHLHCCDAKHMPFARHSFAAVISNSIVHHIPEPARVISEMLRVVKPGGTILVRDLLRPPDMPTLELIVRTYAGDANDHQKKMFSESLHAALTVAEVQEMVHKLGGEPSEVRQTSDRHWTWCRTNRT